MATVELNIVCFRYRFGTPGNPVTDEVANELNRRIVIELQESGAVVPSTTLIDGRVAIRAAFVNHRTTRAEVDTLVNATLAAGRALRDTLHATAQTTEKKWEPWLECENRVLQLNAKLDAESNLPTDAEAVLRIERATLLAQMGRNLEARSDYLRVLELDPANHAGLIGLGRLLVTERHLKAAQCLHRSGQALSRRHRMQGKPGWRVA
jgi:hypothetical protein